MLKWVGKRRDARKSRLFGPIITVGLGSLVLLAAVSAFLIARFDDSASRREYHMVEHGLGQQMREFEAVVVPQVNWDDAVLALDHTVNIEWANFNIGDYLYTFNGFSRSFVLDADARPVYVAVNGKQARPQDYEPFRRVTHELLPAIRKAEKARGPFKLKPGNSEVISRPIQAHGFDLIDGQTYIVIATLVQPDFGTHLPKRARAPVLVTAMPMNSAMLGAFSKRYLLEDLKLRPKGFKPANDAAITLHSPTGAAIGTLTWTPRLPGTMLLEQLRLPLAFALILLGLLGWLVMRRGALVANDLIASEARAQHLAYHDALTGLPNRAKLFERLGAMLEHADDRENQVAILCVDLDRFKEVNDSLGHHAGDLLIRETAMRLVSQCGEGCLISRLGGDEFVVLVRVAAEAEAVGMAQRILDGIHQPLASEYGRLEVGCSIGLAIIDRPDVDPSMALRRADLALYRSKELGRCRVTLFDPEMESRQRLRRTMEADLRKALANGSLTMVYQPQVNQNGASLGVEALLRWHHPKHGQVPPDLFIPLAEECGLILGIGEFVLRRVFEETAGWSRLRIAINISAVQLRSPGFAAQVTRLVAEHGIDPGRYELEITETALLGDDQTTVGNVELLSKLGFGFALDDFGTGYSSLSVLQRFSVNKIKIDRSFVSKLGGSEDAEPLVAAMVRMGRALNLKVIAEGVETESQMIRLLDCGCDEFQGHLLGMPAAAETIIATIDCGIKIDPREVSTKPKIAVNSRR